MGSTIKKIRISIMALFLTCLFTIPIDAFGAEDVHSLTIKGNETQSNDSYHYLTLVHKPDNSYIWEDELSIYQDYDGSATPGSSRVTYKIDKDFISNTDSYYDITVEYYDAGIGTILLQSSTDANNSINYGKTGYGGYAEEEWWSWGQSASLNNIVHSLTNTQTFSSHTFKVTDDFFDDNVDNYIHLYYGRTVNYDDVLRIKSITVTKRKYKIDSIDRNSSNNTPLLGNIYSSHFGMGFKVHNTSADSENVIISYAIHDSLGNTIFNECFESESLAGNSEIKKYIKEPEKFGTYTLEISVSDQDNIIETESIKFSKIPKDLSDSSSSFLAINSIFGHSGWASERQINNAVVASKKLGINDVRTFVNGAFIKEDITSGGYTNALGRYEYTLDSLIDYHSQNILFNADPYDAFVEIDANTGKLTAESFTKILNETINLYSDIARKYGNRTDYYEILNEWNLTKEEITPEQLAEIEIKTAIAIKKIDPTAKIIAVSANKFPIYNNIDYSNFSTNSWYARVLDAEIVVEEDLSGHNNVPLSILEVVDALSIHPYSVDATTAPESAKDSLPSVNESLINFRKMIEYYKNKQGIEKDIPIWVTEMGYSTLPHQVTEREQASYLTRFLLWSLANNGKDTLDIEKVYLWYLADESVTNNIQGESYGLLNSYKSDNDKSSIRDVELSAKESYVAVDAYGSLFNGFSVDGIRELTKDEYYFYQFMDEGNKKSIYTIWNNTNTVDKQVSLDVIEGEYSMYDMFGNIIGNGSVENGHIVTDITNTPTYIVVVGADNPLLPEDNNEDETNTLGAPDTGLFTGRFGTTECVLCITPAIIIVLIIAIPKTRFPYKHFRRSHKRLRHLWK